METKVITDRVRIGDVFFSGVEVVTNGESDFYLSIFPKTDGASAEVRTSWVFDREQLTQFVSRLQALATELKIAKF